MTRNPIRKVAAATALSQRTRSEIIRRMAPNTGMNREITRLITLRLDARVQQWTVKRFPKN